jgi:hypothetical protein
MYGDDSLASRSVAAEMTLPRAEFAAINRVALQQAEGLLREWFPNGKRHGLEFRVGSIEGEPGKSFSIIWRRASGRNSTGWVEKVATS